MGFFDKLKQITGIGGVKLQVQPDASIFVRGGGTLSGNIAITSKTDQQITSILVKVQEIVRVREGETFKDNEYDLGSMQAAAGIEIKAGESKTVPFSVTYTGGRTIADSLQAKGGAMGMLGKIGAMASNEQLTYRVHAHAKVVGAPLGSGNSVQLSPTNG
jgi:hypothetical protein